MKRYLYKICFSLLFFVPLLLFSQVIFSKKGLFFHYFLFDTNIDWWHFLVTSVKDKGIFPFWANGVFMGFPLVANIEQGFFYPFNWINFVFPLPLAFSLNVFIHIVGGVFFTYLYCRQIGISRLAALCGGWVFMMNGIVWQNYIHLFCITSIVWLPLLFYFAEKIFSRPGQLQIKYIILAGLALGAQSLSGMFQTFYYTFVFFVLYFLFRAFFYGKSFRLRDKILPLFLISLISLGIFAVQLLPAYELITHSARASLNYRGIVHPSGESLGLENFIEMLFPNYSQGNYVRQFTHHYFGFAVVIMIFVSVLLSQRNKYIQFFTAVSFISIIFALGRHTPFCAMIYRLRLPGFSVLKDPTRINVIFMFGFSVLSAFGMNKIVGASTSREKRQLSFIAIAVYLIIAVVVFFHLRSKYLSFSNLPGNTSILNPERFPFPFLWYLHSMEWREYCVMLILGLAFFVSLYLFYNKALSVDKYKLVLLAVIFLSLYLFRIAEVPFRNLIARKDIEPLANKSLTVSFFKKDKDNNLYRIVPFDISGDGSGIYRKIENKGIPWGRWMVQQEVSQILYKRNNLLENTALYYRLDSAGGRAVAPFKRYLEFTNGNLNITVMRHKNFFSFFYYPNFLKLSNIKYVIVPGNIEDRRSALKSLERISFNSKGAVVIENTSSTRRSNK